FLTYYLQVVRGYPPVKAGLAFLPLSAAVLLAAQVVAGRLLPRVGPRVLIVSGLIAAGLAMLLLTTLSVRSGYPTRVLPAEIVLGLGMGCVFVPAMNAATQRIDPRDGGVAAAVVNTFQPICGSLGVPLLNTMAATATAGYLGSHAGTPTVRMEALIHGYTVAAAWAAAVLFAGALLATLLINGGRNE